MADIHTPWALPICTPEAWLQDLEREPVDIAIHKIIKIRAMRFQRRRFIYAFPIVSRWGLMTPRVRPYFTPGTSLAGFM